MEEPQFPEKELINDFKKEEKAIHNNLITLNELFLICSDESLSMDQIVSQCAPLLEKFKKLNPLAAEELEALIASKERKNILNFFEEEKRLLTQNLNEEMKQHLSTSKIINDKKNHLFPTDS